MQYRRHGLRYAGGIKMIIREAKENELQKIMFFYNMMCQELGRKDFLPQGNKGGFPSQEMVIAAIKNNQLYVGEEDRIIMAAYIMNHEADSVYDTVNWHTDAPKNEVSVLHALRVHPLYSGKGYASRLVEHSIETAIKKGQKAIRLDCIEGNSIPHKMYCSYGFEYIDTVEICYEDIGVPRNFLLFERVL